MFETDKYDPGLHLEGPASPRISYEPVDNIDGMSFLLWGEHCVECGVPTCYTTCDLYKPRSDWRCQRFAFGLYKNPAFPSARGYGVEARFKKWAKLETFGNTAIYPLSWLLRLERSIEPGARVGNLVGALAHRMRKGSNWEQVTYIGLNRLTNALHRQGRTRRQPEAFLLEIYNPEAEEVRLQLIFSVAVMNVTESQKHLLPVPPIITTIVLPPGYSRHQFSPALFRPFLDRELPFKITLVPEAESNARLVFLTADLVTFKDARSKTQSSPGPKPIKCIVWDLDNTLWHGTLVEGDKPVLRPGIVEQLKYFDERGVLMSIASKNDAKPALAWLKHFGLDEYFLYPQIDWLPKSHKIQKIAQQLNLSLDAFAFIDDNSFELAEVSAALPQVTCINVDALEQLASNPRFEGSVTEESRQRRHYYQQQVARETEQTAFAGDYLGFIRSCKIILDIAPYQQGDEERVAELVQRTNQLNFSGRKYSRAQLQEIIKNPGLDKYVLRCSDRYGAYGAIGFCIVEQAQRELHVIDFMVSCRVQGKFIEQAFFSHLLQHHNKIGAEALWVNFHSTERNTPAREVLQALGFEQGNLALGGLILRQTERLNCDFITVACSVQNCTEQLARAV